MLEADQLLKTQKQFLIHYQVKILPKLTISLPLCQKYPYICNPKNSIHERSDRR